jgi:ubiquinone/menaquinone biosynthesis C-methylase UbiE
VSDERKDLGEHSDYEAMCELVDVSGLNLIDVGCGPAAVSRQFAALGAKVLGVEPDPIQAEKNRQAEPVPGLTFVEGVAENLPAESGTVDGVFFFRSLHHVPIDHMDAALVEAARVLKPDTGFLCIVEPAVTGTNFPIMKPFHDETHVRAEAQAALARMSGNLFRTEERYRYFIYPRHASFDDFVDRVMGQTFNSHDRAKVVSDEVRTLFEAGRTDAGDYRFEQPMLINLYRGVLK